MSDANLLGADSPLKSVLSDFTPRPAQQLMAEAVDEALRQRSSLVIEAGTGTGKTFAYLVPAISGGQKTIVSTGTRALQDQLFHRDIPLLVRALGSTTRVALLKGRANYLCRYRLELARQRADADRFAAELARIEHWATATRAGDRREVTDVAEDSPVWPLVTSTLENCVGQRCEFYDRCHVVRARREAQGADLVVVNHHLLLADLAMKEGGFDQFLPGSDAFVIDEAHQLADIAGHFFGTSFGLRALGNLLDEALLEGLTAGGPGLVEKLDACRTAALRLREAAPREPGRYEYAGIEAALAEPLGELGSALSAVREALEPIAGLSAGLESVGARAEQRLGELVGFVDESSVEGLRWVDVGRHTLALNLTPLDVSETLGSMLRAQSAAWVFTSATLAVGEDFGHFVARLGITEARTIKLDSPYDLASRSCIYQPAGMPEPSAREYTAAVMAAASSVAAATRGGVFVLFTSHRALRAAADWAARQPSSLGGRPLLVQGEAPRDDLLRRFRAAGNALLLATGTFWEGVDVRGPALTAVVIDKLPFASPGDPLVMARLEYLKRRGENGFTAHQLPQAVLALKQGVGRLLRDDEDYGVVVLCDPRIGSRAYGRQFLTALQPMPATSELDRVRAFFARFEG